MFPMNAWDFVEGNMLQQVALGHWGCSVSAPSRANKQCFPGLDRMPGTNYGDMKLGAAQRFTPQRRV
jgi:hypothetical protein